MKSEILLDAIGKIDDELIASAGEVRDRSRIKMWLRCGALAACLGRWRMFSGGVVCSKRKPA